MASHTLEEVRSTPASAIQVSAVCRGRAARGPPVQDHQL